MRIFKKISDIQSYLQIQKDKGLSVGFVPTMGALHKGHLSLLETCKTACDMGVVSIFVNPTQFNDKKDLEKYPRTIEKDITLLVNAGCDVLFYPEVEEMYPNGEITRIYDLKALENLFEGAFRPGHFQGVCQVVDKLFSIVQPQAVFFGQKDYQQCMVIKRLIDTTPAFGSIEMTIVPTMRETNGLAMSSRNARLSEEEKQLAPTIYQTLLFLKGALKAGPMAGIKEAATLKLNERRFITDYVGIADAYTLEPVDDWDGQKPLVALIAAFLGPVRLIDNLVIA
ncbi:pantoate--beta-alanine ligase [Niabella yanshanensis]|uniref:Pantothenate synthetase n=1 Tax=Niabella yanshanensis TaxID=577386 RepID=A0ABZ0W706_9BACT|nr:pantoate--beta-alanine ligase [Niabella yanshanensis]WQD39037.1 pantoate--beta-alanine ligase [Niabella yanshanensis]